MSKSRPADIQATTHIAADPRAVWALVSDVRRMPDFSPELRKVVPLGRSTGNGARFLGINRRGFVVWPTRSTIVRWEPGKAVAWRTRESGATWLYEMTGHDGGTTLTGRRILSRFTAGTTLMAPVVGGAQGHDVELGAGIRTTLERMKASLESGTPAQ